MTEASDVIAVIEPILGRGIQLAEVREPAQDARRKIPSLTPTTATGLFHFSGRRLSRSMTWYALRRRPPRSYALPCWNSKLPGG